MWQVVVLGLWFVDWISCKVYPEGPFEHRNCIPSGTSDKVVPDQCVQGWCRSSKVCTDLLCEAARSSTHGYSKYSERIRPAYTIL